MFSTEIIVPTVIVVASVGGYFIYRRYQSMWEPPKGPLVVPVRVITLEQLREFDGSNGKDCYVAVKGVVFDVTRNLASYGPGAGYSNLAAKDASFVMRTQNPIPPNHVVKLAEVLKWSPGPCRHFQPCQDLILRKGPLAYYNEAFWRLWEVLMENWISL